MQVAAAAAGCGVPVGGSLLRAATARCAPPAGSPQQSAAAAAACRRLRQQRRHAAGPPPGQPPPQPPPAYYSNMPPPPPPFSFPQGQPPYPPAFDSSGGGGNFQKGPPKSQELYVLRPPLNKGVNFVPEGEYWVVERFGRYKDTLKSGINFLIPGVDRIAYVHSAKEQMHEIPNQSAVTRDNVAVTIDGVLFMQIVDAHKASYNIQNVVYNIVCVAQTTMRSEIGTRTLDELFKERDELNQQIRDGLRQDANLWGVDIKRYEIRDIMVSDLVRRSMDLQAQAVREQRKVVTESEGEATAQVNRAEAEKKARVLRAEADAESVRIAARAHAESIRLVSQAIAAEPHSRDAMSLDVARRYVDAFSGIAREGNTVLLPADLRQPSAMVAQAMSIYKAVATGRHGAAAAEADAGAPRTDAGADEA
eukprot:TRINITY_DN56320_c0_g1_i1.p1 TRINITY_DN56320_c0_g1~~TRINITY_DN56320_c0_g1_i1.p1  ORF type:complete len:445 (+),score=156.25 TRINITY_DN56320_c0_g1_i1:74-1336(+)